MNSTGARLCKLREELSLTQKEFATVIQVDANTYAKWEKLEKPPSRANKKKVEFLLELEEIEQLKEVMKKTTKSEGRLNAAAGLFGLMYSLWAASGFSLTTLWTQLTSESSWMIGVAKLNEKAKTEGGDNKKI